GEPHGTALCGWLGSASHHTHWAARARLRHQLGSAPLGGFWCIPLQHWLVLKTRCLAKVHSRGSLVLESNANRISSLHCQLSLCAPPPISASAIGTTATETR